MTYFLNNVIVYPFYIFSHSHHGRSCTCIIYHTFFENHVSFIIFTSIVYEIEMSRLSKNYWVGVLQTDFLLEPHFQVYTEDDMWFHILTKFGKVILIICRTLLIKDSQIRLFSVIWGIPITFCVFSIK